MHKVTRTERGWGAHFIGAFNCKFKRNTLLESPNGDYVISTVGAYAPAGEEGRISKIHDPAYYETSVFLARNDKYKDADVSKEVFGYDSQSTLNKLDDIKANDMHETVVAEITKTLEKNCNHLGSKTQKRK